MEQNLENLEYRRQLIKEIKGTENNYRMSKSLQDWDIYSGNIRPYVEQRLKKRFSASLVKEIPIVSCINVLKKTVKTRASLYKNPPSRDFTLLSDDQKDLINLVYKDMRFDAQMLLANELFELQKQTHVLIEPKNGKLTVRPVKCHQLNVKPSDIDPEMGEIYIFSSYDKSQSDEKTFTETDNHNQQIGDPDDYKALSERYVIWSKSFHFVMDGKGNFKTDDTVSPLLSEGVVPIIEIAGLKDFVYWLNQFNEDSEFSVDINSSQSLVGQIVEMQGFSQAYLKTTEDLMPTSIDVGPSRILKLVIDPNVSGSDNTEFGYATPSSDIQGAMNYSDSLIAKYLSSQGQSPSSISSSATTTDKFTSGTDRLLAQIEKFESSKDTLDIFAGAEYQIYKVVLAWINVLSKSDRVDNKYKSPSLLPSDSELIINYKMPTAVLTDMEKLDKIDREVELGFKTKAEAYSDYRGVPLKEAEEIIANNAKRFTLTRMVKPFGLQDDQDENEQ